MFWMGQQRRQALRSGAVKPSDIALRQPHWPPRATQVANCFHNQLELPMLFYVLVAFILITRTNDSSSWCSPGCSSLSRLVHAYIHTGANDVRSRSLAIGVGAIVLVAMWVIFAVAHPHRRGL